MTKKASFEEVVAKAKAVHGSAYEYLDLDRTTAKPILRLSCKAHGEFSQQLSNHLSGKGCAKCALEATSRSAIHTLESVTDIGTRLHKGKYTYVALERIKLAPILTLICNRHGEFKQEMYAHLAGKGCAKCANKYELVDILNKAHEVHLGKYDYVSYIEGSEILQIYCKEHGVFSQSRQSHLAGCGCTECGKLLAAAKIRISVEEAQAKVPKGLKVISVERNCLDRGKGSFVAAVCELHGQFRKSSSTIQNGCPKCSYAKKSLEASTSLEEYTEKALLVHKGLYGYLALERDTSNYPKVLVACQSHGVFSQGMAQHLQGYRCPKCATAKSLVAGEFVTWIQSVEPSATLEARLGESKSRWDASVDSKKLAFEFHGLYWHSEQHKPKNYHYDKHQQGLAAGFRTIHIFEDEWTERPEAVRALISNSLGKVSEKVSARNCSIVEVAHQEAKSFLNNHHIQGSTSASKYLGLTCSGKLAAVMGYAFRESGRGKALTTHSVELTRYASSVQVVGGFSKLLKHLERTSPDLRTVYTFSDTRCFSGAMYAKCGFTQVAELKPDYFYVRAGKRQHKATLQKSNFRSNPKLLFDASLTERELAELNNFFRVYDCGKVKWQKTIS